ncbi:MAG: RNA polymerase sigma factor [Thermoguttaceae bacterium]
MLQTDRPNAAFVRTARDTEHPAPPMRSDEELLADYIRTQNHEAFEELVQRHERDLYGYLRRYLGNMEMAEDAFQATFLKVHVKCGQFQAGRRVRPWLYTIATHQAIDLLRRNRRHRSVRLNLAEQGGSADCAIQDLLQSHDANPGRKAEEAEENRRVWSAVEELPKRLKEVIVLVMLQGLRYREAAEVLGLAVGTVKSRVHMAIARLRKVMAGAPYAGCWEEHAPAASFTTGPLPSNHRLRKSLGRALDIRQRVA